MINVPPEVMKKVEEEIKKEGRLPKILIYSHAPFVRSSEGVICNYLSTKLLDHGVTVLVAAHYGLELGGMLKFGQITVLPVDRREDEHGFLSTIIHYLKFNMDYILYLHDFWEITPLKQFNVIPMAKIDSIEYPENMIAPLKECRYVIAPTEFAKQELEKYGIKAEYCPIGVSISSYRQVNKEECKQLFGIKKEEFVIGIVASNREKEKKGWDSNFETIKKFFEKKEEAREKTRILIHSEKNNPQGENLEAMSKAFGIDQRIIWQDQHLLTLGVPEGTMNRVYGAMDVLLNLSRREGTCLPVLEAGMVGTPSIVTNFGVMKERVNNGKCGWLVPVKEFVSSPYGAKVPVADTEKASDILVKIYEDRDKIKVYGKKAREYAMRYSWDTIIGQYWFPFMQKLGKELKETSPSERENV